MISIGKVTSAAGYSEYLSGAEKNGAVEYYSGEQVPSQWSGALAMHQGRTGEVDEKSFVEALSGRLEDGTGQRQLSQERSNWIPAYDVTIGAPKSISIEALVHGNPDALESHREAVHSALEKLESGINARVTTGGKTGYENTGNAQIASFEHHTSVTGDPHLHTHNVTVNATVCGDGKARAIDAKASIYGHVNEIKEAYHQALENSLEKRGIQTYRDEHGSPQIVGYDKDGMREFSQRQQQIDSRLKERGSAYDTASPQERELARQETRKGVEKPEPKSREAAQAAWREKAEHARDRGAEIGPAQRTETQARIEKSPEQKSVSREEFQAAKWTVNEGMAAEQRLQSGNYRSDAHKAQLEQRIEKMAALKTDKPDLYARAEKSVERMGVRDADAKIDAAAASRVRESPTQKADHEAAQLQTAKWVVGKGQDAQEALDSGRSLSDSYRAQLEDRVEKTTQLKAQNPNLHEKAEQAWDKDMGEMKRTIRQAQDADRRLPSGNFVSERHRDDLERAQRNAQAAQERQPAMYSMAERAVQREDRARDEQGNGKANTGGAFEHGRPADSHRSQFRENVNTLRDADLAARALKTDNGLVFGFGRKELSAKDKAGMERVYNSRGDLFYQDKKGNVYSSGLSSKGPATFSKKEDALFGLGSREYIVNQKGEVFVRGGGITGGIQQRFANSLKGDGNSVAGRIWNNTVQEMFGSKWQKATGAEARRLVKEAIEARKDYYNAKTEMRESLRQDVKNAASAISERPQEMTRAYDAMKARGQEVRVDKSAQKAMDQARDDIKQERTAGQSGAGRGGPGLQSVAGAARDELHKDLVTQAEREKAQEQARERDRIEAEKVRLTERRTDADARQKKVDASGKQEGAVVKSAQERAGAQAETSTQQKQDAHDSAGQDNYARAQAERLIAERREAQTERTQTAAGAQKDAMGNERQAGRGRPELDQLKAMREEVGKLAESVIRQAGYDRTMQGNAMGMNAANATATQLEQFVQKYGSAQQKEQMETLKERLAQTKEIDARNKLAEQEKARAEKLQSKDEPSAVNLF